MFFSGVSPPLTAQVIAPSEVCSSTLPISSSTDMTQAQARRAASCDRNAVILAFSLLLACKEAYSEV